MLNKQNAVLDPSFKTSRNFYESDLILQHFLEQNLSPESFAFMLPHLNETGEKAATIMDQLSQQADKNPPTLRKRNAYGEELNSIEFHPAYQTLKKIAVDSGMFSVKWDPANRYDFKEHLHQLGFAAGYLFVMGEVGLYCPLCMTDGVARILDRYADEDDKNRLLPHIATEDVEELFTGAMFLTEKAGGSDVGANLVKADHQEGKYYLLYGEKWFCSNADAEIILALARVDENIPGTKGLSIFLIEKNNSDGSKNHRNIVRLKDKIGVRSMASAEIILENTEGKLLGKEGEGFKIMAEMINLSRLYNSVTASAIIRRVLIEGWQFLNFRSTFGKPILEHVLVCDKLAEIATLHLQNFYFTWHTIKLLDKADNGDPIAQNKVRLLTPMLKKSTAEDAVYACREMMEAVGGIAYIEESVFPKFLRDALVLPIWEGAGNIMILDMMRAAFKENCLPEIFNEINENISGNEVYTQRLNDLTEKVELFKLKNTDEQQLYAKYFFSELISLYRQSLLLKYKDDISSEWMEPALKLLNQKEGESINISIETLRQLIAWEF